MARRQTVTDMITEQEFQGSASSLVDFLGFALDNHPRLDFGSTGRHQLAVNLYEANEARIKRTALFEVTKSGDVETQGARRRQDGVVGSNVDALSVDGNRKGGHRGAKSEGRNPKAERRPKSETRRRRNRWNLSLWSMANIRYFLQIAPKMRFSSFASRQSRRASRAKLGSEVAIMRRKNMASLDSFLHVPIFSLNSFPETESSASQ
jgi:hypothetical protein